MKKNNSGPQNNFNSSVIFCALMATLSCSVLASEKVSVDDNKVDDNKVDDNNKLIVTGTRIKKLDINSLSPILSISREEIDKLGYSNIKDVIDGLTQNSGGTIDNSSTMGFTPGASSVNLRGVGFGHTLVLVDGRRLPIYPIAIGGTDNFVDLSSIPMAFVERIDVLTDGASAIYGSDAVSGVINIITYKDIEGISMNYRAGDSSGGGYENHRFNLITGARNGDTQIDLILDFWQQKALWANQRDYARSDVVDGVGQFSGGGASFIGLDSGQVYQHPDCGTANDPLGGQGIPDVEVSYFGLGEVWCGFDRSPYRQLIAPQKRSSVMTRVNYDISSDLAFFGRVGYSINHTETQMEPFFYGGALFDGYGAAVENYGGIAWAGEDNNPTTGSAFEEDGIFVRRLVEFGPRTSDVDGKTINLLGGLKGVIDGGAFDWEVGFSYNKTDLTTLSNNVLLSALNAAVENGLDLFQVIPEATVNALGFVALEDSYSLNRVLDGSITGDLGFGFDGGPVQFALAFEHVSENYSDQSDPRVEQGDAFDGASSGFGKRKHIGLGGELSFPFTDTFDLDLALRWDKYDDESDVGSAFSPKLALGYAPQDNLLFRVSTGKSFRAPDMQRLFGGETQGFVDILDPEFQYDQAGELCDDPASNPACQPELIESVRLYTFSNPYLKEERGTNANMGVLWEPFEGLSLSLDYYKIKLKDLVTTVSPQSLVNICYEYDELCDLIIRDPMGTLASGAASISTFALNFAEQDSEGVDLALGYQWRDQVGSWSSNLALTWLNSSNVKFSPESEAYDRVDSGEVPEYRANLTLDWQRGDWGATFRGNYVDKIAGLFCFDCSSAGYVKAWTTFSASLSYNYSSYTRFRLGMNNLTDKEPPQDPTQVVWPRFINDGGYYSSVGREYYLQLETRL